MALVEAIVSEVAHLTPPDGGVYFSPEALVNALCVMAPAFMVLGLMYLVSRKQRENYAGNPELQNEDAISYIKGHSVSRIEKGINGAVLFAPLALALLWGKIIPESLTVPALCVAATVGFGVGAFWERKLPKENKYHNWLN